MSSLTSPALAPMRRMNDKLDSANGQIEDFMQAQAGGERPDPAAFMGMLEKKAAAQQALQAQLKLHEKPLKTVLSEVR